MRLSCACAEGEVRANRHARLRDDMHARMQVERQAAADDSGGGGFALRGRHCVVIGKGALAGAPTAALLGHERLVGCTVSSCDVHTPSTLLRQLLATADIVVSAAGAPTIGADGADDGAAARPHWVKPGAVLIDAGTRIVGAQTQPPPPPPALTSTDHGGPGSGGSSTALALALAADEAASSRGGGGVTGGGGGTVVGDVADWRAMLREGRCSYVTPTPGGVGPMTVAALLHQTTRACELQQPQPQPQPQGRAGVMGHGADTCRWRQTRPTGAAAETMVQAHRGGGASRL
jgi:hypothetical protein